MTLHFKQTSIVNEDDIEPSDFFCNYQFGIRLTKA